MKTALSHTRDDVSDAIRAVQNGDREQFSVVVQQYHVQLRVFIASLIHTKFDADDLAQDTFVFAFQHIHEFEPGTNFMAWVKAIAYNHVRDYFKNRTENVSFKLRQEILRNAREAIADGVDPRLELLEECLAHMPHQQRAFLKTVCGRRTTLDEVAIELNRSGTAVRKHLSRLYETLRLCVEQRLAAQSGGGGGAES